MGVFLGVDHGGSTTTSVLVSESGDIVGRASVPTERRTPFSGWVEHDADSFVTGSLASSAAALESAGLKWTDVRAVGIANQGETSIAWDSRTRRAVAPALSWQDKRTLDRCNALREAGFEELVARVSGLSIDPYFSASKYGWLAHATDEARAAHERGTLRLGGTDAYLIDRLTGGARHATDPSTGSRTALMNLDSLAWSPELLALFDVPAAAMPALQPSSSEFGIIDHPDVSAKGIPIAADLVDAHAALFMHELWSPNSIKATFGTGAFIETSVGSNAVRPTNGLIPFVGWQIDDDTRYVLEGSVFDVGASVDWLVQMGLVGSAADTEDLAEVAVDSAGLVFVPSFSGLAAPHWDGSARAVLSGMSLKTRPEHVVRALLEGIASSVAEVILMLLEEAGRDDVLIKADGGPSRNAFLMQLLADAVGMPIRVSGEPDVTALGAACLAGVSVKHFTLDDLRSIEPSTREFLPASNTASREARRREWQRVAANLAAHHN